MGKGNYLAKTLTLRPSELRLGQSATCVRFNSKQPDLLACSYSGCLVRIFQLSDQLAAPSEGEETFLTRLLNEQKST